MIRTLRLTGCAVVASAAAFAVGAPAVSAQGPQATAAKTCSLAGSYSRLGPTYVQSLAVRNTSCATGKSVVRAFYSCRRAHGRKGRCTRKVLGYSCSERRSTGYAQFVGKVSCRRGIRRVAHTYSQNF